MSDRRSRALYIGRWSPFHNGHDAIIRKSLEIGEPVLIAVRDTPVGPSDPWPAGERAEMIREHYWDQNVEVIVISDISSVNVGRAVGYELREIAMPEGVEAISGTGLRKQILSGEAAWRDKVPSAVAARVAPGRVVWLTGCPSAGKTTLAKRLERCLTKSVLLDADILRLSWPDLGFSRADRIENVARIALKARRAAREGAIAVVACIAPYAEARALASTVVSPHRIQWVYLYCPLDELRKRDTRGLYAKQAAGEISGLTGVDDVYEEPANALRLDTSVLTINECSDRILNLL